ncbi:error-prone DNA polymerase [Marinimicrobium sp. ARAG 43.8]|uniref:error-prone DNA polymerase n=1 Tax=Marinimicrobium sp. ARAG 43.8 TaxID=3418719 RepID=UPI003CFA354C
MSYAELVCQSNFSFLEGASHPEELVAQAGVLGYKALAITDECSVAGVVRAYAEGRDSDTAPALIVGSRFRIEGELDLVLLCPSRQAYAELCRIITNARRRCPKGEYRLEEWDIKSLQYCLLLWLPSGRPSDQAWGRWLKKHHAERLWLAVRCHLTEAEHRYRAHCETLARELALPVCACGDVLMHHAERLPLQQVLTAIRLGTTVVQAGRRLQSNAERRLRSLPRLQSLFPASWLTETLRIAERCRFDLGELRYEYPSELVPKGKTAFSWLCHLVDKGIAKRFPEGVSGEIQTTIDKELDLIESLGYAHFFLTIHDLVRFAQEHGILYQGRGSAANSVVCYCLEITAVDPRHIKVLFERFLSRERNEPPDIDVDFEHQRREEVIQYIYRKYGRPRAALAATVITYRFKSALRDVGKALGINESHLDFLIRQTNRRDRGTDWASQVAEAGLDPNADTGRHLIQRVNELRGFPRHLSQHVGGFVISSGPLYELVPVENAAMTDRTVIQWDKDDIETLGLLKVDVLALGMLTALRRGFDLVREHWQRELTLSGVCREMTDKAVYEMIQRGDTVGLFQIESRAQMSMLPRLKPACYYDLVIQIAIVRPGPIQGGMVHPFLKRRNGEEKEEYPSEAVKGVLERTLGVPIFQEQVIHLAMVAAGFSGGEADQLRRAMAAWKKTGDLDPLKDKLIKGMTERGYPLAYAERIYQQIRGFGEYGFPESHSASFALLAYASAWMKYHYPEAFYAALMNSHPMGFYSPSQLVQDARRHGVEIRPVCINHSGADHRLESTGKSTDKSSGNGWAIRLGFRIVTGLSRKAIEAITGIPPDVHGYRFRALNDIHRLGLAQPDREALAGANALHSLSNNRYQSRWALMDRGFTLPLFAAQPSEETLAAEAETTPYLPVPSDIDNLVEDYASVGLTLNRHPIALLDEAGCLGRFVRATALGEYRHGALVTVIGVVTGRQSPGTASGVTFITLEDDTGNHNVIVWLATARAQKQAYLTARVLRVRGTVEREGEVIHVIAGKLEDLSDCLENLSARSRDFH